MKNVNLTEWALNHRGLVYYFIILIFVMGILSYRQLGRMEDPDFVIRQMVVSAAWPGATAREVEEQVTDKLEKKLQDTPGLDYLKSYSRPGQAVIYVNLKEELKEEDIRPTWLEIRNQINDIKGTLPQGVVGPAFNDRFDDVYGCILRSHRRRLHIRGDARPRREDSSPAAGREKRQKGRTDRRAGRENLYRDREQQTGPAGHRSEPDYQHNQGPERDDGLGDGRNILG
jgi:hypothetical protein